ncbi:putative allantoin permease [Maliponia aquimaris]|uniref:Putative allantoin permease n=1 Tax=Maliponia aquimaris TaxID=1673631 RepID=A0A238L1J1_9RHOB|nr:putative allantoin permease [Maliponia aquimaris]
MASFESGHVSHGGTMDAEGNTLNPAGADEKTWGAFAIFNIWANDVQSLFGYSLVASLFISFGVGGWTAFAALITAGLFVMWMVNLSGAPGEKYGIPYPVVARASLGRRARSCLPFCGPLSRCSGMAFRSILPQQPSHC